MDQRAHFTEIVFHERTMYQVCPLAGCKWAEPAPADAAENGMTKAQMRGQVCSTGDLTR